MPSGALATRLGVSIITLPRVCTHRDKATMQIKQAQVSAVEMRSGLFPAKAVLWHWLSICHWLKKHKLSRWRPGLAANLSEGEAAAALPFITPPSAVRQGRNPCWKKCTCSGCSPKKEWASKWDSVSACVNGLVMMYQCSSAAGVDGVDSVEAASCCTLSRRSACSCSTQLTAVKMDMAGVAGVENVWDSVASL